MCKKPYMGQNKTNNTVAVSTRSRYDELMSSMIDLGGYFTQSSKFKVIGGRERANLVV